MLDIKFVRTHPDEVKENIKKKFQDYKLPMVDEVIELDAKSREAQQKASALRSERNKLSKQIGGLMAKRPRPLRQRSPPRRRNWKSWKSRRRNWPKRSPRS